MHTQRPGRSYPIGATLRADGVNFSIYSHNARSIELLLFDRPDQERPSEVIKLDPEQDSTFYYWHVFVPGLQEGQIYAFRADGPWEPRSGLRFDRSKVLLDPYGRAVVNTERYDRRTAERPGYDNCAVALKSAVVDPRSYDWEGDMPLHRPFGETVIYEMHVGGFTAHPSSKVKEQLRGTYAGLIEKIPYLVDLGVTAVELLPVQQFDRQDAPGVLPNFWGYSPLSFFAPHRAYSSRKDVLGPADEFRDMVKALHRAGIEVILDVVFNHTAEGNEQGPTISWRGLENRAYYILSRPDRTHYANFSGCGNTINGNHSIVRRMIMDCLRYWVQVMHVDGFRFDLASVLARDEEGHPLVNPPILWEIESDPVLAGSKIIAEAWDAGGLYQVGSFVGHRWAEWNGQYRDDVRRFVKSDGRTVGKVASRIVGSRDIYHEEDREPHRSINFITAHDGFTLNDLVSYNVKHNEANGEQNRDGDNHNNSWNCGAEGPTRRPAVTALRSRQIRNFFTVLLASQGTPMLLMGDEVRRTQNGNNNAYCQDNELGWFDWRLVKKHADVHRFVRELLRFRSQFTIFASESFWLDRQQVIFHGLEPLKPDWGDASHALGCEVRDDAAGERILLLLNAYWGPLQFKLPAPQQGQVWRLVVDTHLPSPFDALAEGYQLPAITADYMVEPRTVVLLRQGRPSSNGRGDNE